MSITYPLDILADFPGWTVDFDLMWRQEQSRTANGRTVVKDLGSPLWRASYVSRSLAPNLLDEWRARLDALENGMQTFRGYPLSRCYPIAYPNGSWPGVFDGESATVSAVGVDNKSLQADLLPAGFHLSVGDMVQVRRGSTERRDLYRVQEAVTASGGGATGAFEVRPHLWPGIAVDDVVTVKRPWCAMAIVPGSIASPADPSTGRGTVSFQAVETR